MGNQDQNTREGFFSLIRGYLLMAGIETTEERATPDSDYSAVTNPSVYPVLKMRITANDGRFIEEMLTPDDLICCAIREIVDKKYPQLKGGNSMATAGMCVTDPKKTAQLLIDAKECYEKIAAFVFDGNRKDTTTEEIAETIKNLLPKSLIPEDKK